MLIKIDDTVINQIQNSNPPLTEVSEEVIALNNIATAISDGLHIITASLETLEFLYRFELLTHNSRRMYFNLFDKFTYLPAYEDFFCEYILVKNRDISFSRKRQGEHIIFEVPINHFTRVMSISPSVLLSEDMSDCEFYEKIAKKFISENQQKINTNLQFRLVSGGGSGAFKSYEYELNKNNLVLTISDSDRTYPTDKIGSTLLKLRSVYNKYKQDRVTELIELDVREKENLISPSLYLLCYNVCSKEYLLSLCELESSPLHQEKLRYMDLKGGIRAESLKGNTARKNYLKELFDDASHLVACTFEEIDSKKDDFLIIEGIGGNLDKFSNDILDDGLERSLEQKKNLPAHTSVPEHVIRELEEKILKKQKLFNNLPEYLKGDWEKLSKKIISWGCSNEPVA
ncbi:hypothetical protein COE92_18345 [Bacillus wiedmannii]|uniref:hypothetical protein n=1 Tax=Bacillus wiedmannii TaxID=1890302 RepID=UPI000BFC4A36|nr:hypothetical protein [Bacillus wiedmannii]PHB52893.1 hypothetical protein COE92_18345 [Bacillus wiedmannii]